jgi:hypothetical protein
VRASGSNCSGGRFENVKPSSHHLGPSNRLQLPFSSARTLPLPSLFQPSPGSKIPQGTLPTSSAFGHYLGTPVCTFPGELGDVRRRPGPAREIGDMVGVGLGPIDGSRLRAVSILLGSSRFPVRSLACRLPAFGVCIGGKQRSRHWAMLTEV